MKKILLAFVIIYGVYSCSPKNKPLNSVSQGKGNSTVQVTKEPEVPSTPPTPPPSRPEQTVTDTVNNSSMEYLASGKVLFETKCSKCHELKQPVTYTQQRWVGIINWMSNKAKLSPEEKANILAYVQHNAQDAPKGN